MAPEREIVQTLCRMCDDRCGIDVYLEDGRIVDVLGNKDHLWNRGRLCVKARAAVDMVYHPDRILAPLKRTADGWQEVPLEQALDEIAARLAAVKEKYGARSLSVWKGEAIGFGQQENIARRFVHAMGSPNYLSNDSMCYAARYFGFKLVDGAWPVPDFENARCIVLWGANPPYAHPNMTQYITAARRKGATLVVVDPRLSAIARRADIHANLRPGTDGALAWGLAHEILEMGAQDKDFVEHHTLGFAKVVEYARAFTPEAVEEESGVPAATVRAVARAMVGSAPQVAAYVGNGLEHHENGVNNIRAIAMLDGLLGALDQEGGTYIKAGLPLRDLTLYDEVPLRHLGPLGAERFPVLYDLRQECHTMTAIEAVLEDDPYPLRAMIVTGANPALTNPNSTRVREALAALDLLVVRDLFMTETAALADYVLPAASFLERTELHGHAKHQIVSLTRTVVSWPGVQGEYEFWHDLALRLSIGEYFPWEDETTLNRWLLEPTGLTLEDLVAHPEGVEYSPARPRLWQQTGFATPSGKVEFASEYLKDLGLDELPVYRRPAYREAFDPAYPFVLMTGARKLLYLHSRFRNIARFRTAIPGPEVEMHPDDAVALGVADGEVVRVTSRVGFVEVPVKIMAPNEILPGNLQITHGWKEANVNLITHDDRFDPISGFPLMKSVEVRIEKAHPTLGT
ncbi:MAG TPA: molybdopterin-dependent oxidoreductase [Thermoleophilia bacterium]|nr:molybdopterin-dependent oxidoreductase [Thermoleophilia bacterium]